MLLTRIGTGSKIVVTGDVEQGDRRRPDNGLMDLEHRLETSSVPGLELVKFDKRDIQRHNIIEHVLRVYRD
jgi:phosphate starvation-inducible PhoH-like protein